MLIMEGCAAYHCIYIGQGKECLSWRDVENGKYKNVIEYSNKFLKFLSVILLE